jgi:hypothetical protein
MLKNQRTVIELGSQDLGIGDIARFRDCLMAGSGFSEEAAELIVLSGFSGVSEFHSLSELSERMSDLPKEPSYLHYSLTWPSKARCSIYIDPDLPTRIVLEGDGGWVKEEERRTLNLFQAGDKRYRLHGKAGYLLIWASVIGIATLILMGFIIGSGSKDPMVIIPVIISSGLLGIYLSLVKLKDIQPANTISLVRRRAWWIESVLHLLTIALGVISAIIATVIVSQMLN